MQNLIQAIEVTINDYIQRVADKYKLNKTELEQMWSNSNENKNVDSVVVPKPPSSTKSSTSSSSSATCQYVFSKGAKQGQQCGKKCVNGYCSLHAKHEGKEKKVKKVVPEAKEVSKSVLLRPHPILKIPYHPDTMMAFTTDEPKCAIGVIEKGSVVPLTDETIEICKKYGFRYKQVASNSSEDDVETVINDLAEKSNDNLKQLVKSALNINDDEDPDDE